MTRRKQFLLISILIIATLSTMRIGLSLRMRNDYQESSNIEMEQRGFLLAKTVSKFLELALKNSEDLEGFSKIQSHILKDFDPTEAGYVSVLNGEGRILFHPRPEFVGHLVSEEDMKKRRAGDPTLERMIQDALAGLSGTKRYTFEGMDKTAAFYPAKIGKERWSVFIISPALSESQKITTGFMQFDVIMSIFTIVLMGGFFVLIDRSIFRPLKALTHSLSEISRGNFHAVIDPAISQKKDELGNLAEAFERIMVSLKLAMKMVAGQSDEKFQNRLETLEEKLNQAKQSFKDHLGALDISCLVSTTDINGTINYTNERLNKISQYSAEELNNRNHRILNSGFHSPPFFETLWNTIKDNKTWQGDFRNRAKDGSIFWVRSTITPTRNSEGQVDGYIDIQTLITDLMRPVEEAFSRLAAKEPVSDDMVKRINELKNGGGS